MLDGFLSLYREVPWLLPEVYNNVRIAQRK